MWLSTIFHTHLEKYFYTWKNLRHYRALRFIKNTSKKEANGDIANDDLSLVAAYQKSGDLEVLGELYNKYMHLVFGVCFNYFKDEEQSKDAVMQIFEELVTKLRIHQVQNFKSWLHVLTRNHCLMALRKSSKNPTVALDDNFMENDELVHLDIDNTKETQLTIMEKCMETLSEEQRKSVDLFYLQEKCYKEVAEITGYDMLKVKSYIQNGKRNLKICIEKNSGQ